MSHPPLTLIEKLVARWTDGLAAGACVRSGEFVMIRPRHVMTHDNTGAVIPKFKSIGATKIAIPSQPVFAIDHDIQNVTPENLGKYAKIEAFAALHGVDYYPAGTGISHQVMVEQGYVIPGSMVVGSDSHSNLYGALCALGTPVVRTDAAGIWATGTTWWQVPPVARVELTGALAPGVTGKDVIVALCGLFANDEVLNHAVEFTGSGVASLSVSARMSISNMSTEWGALAGVFPFDEHLRAYLDSRADVFASGHRPGTRRAGSLGQYSRREVAQWWNARHEMTADLGAHYAVELSLDLASVIPHVSGPNDVKVMSSLPAIEAKEIKIQKAWLMSCVNGRLEDIAAAAQVVKGKKIAAGVEFFVAPASAEVRAEAEKLGYWQEIIDCGATILPAGCGTCIGLGAGLIQAGETGISSTNRNFQGRMGDKLGLVYLGSPAVVAASALRGSICSPTAFVDSTPRISIQRNAPTKATASAVRIIDGFPQSLSGRALFMDKNNMNTDGIFAGKHTYNDALAPAEMASVVFENYDGSFHSHAHCGDIVVGGYNFGTGSSREQAATALKYFGIPCVIAGSFSETYKRNAFNNGFLVFDSPQFVDALQSHTKSVARAPTVDVGSIAIDFSSGTIDWRGTMYPFTPLSPVAQELIVAGGAEAVIQSRLKSMSV
ncbi:MAG: homoaconitase [Planctomycetota bacterium]|nr:homoaconitase [Planctomycetota bacterium]